MSGLIKTYFFYHSSEAFVTPRCAGDLTASGAGSNIPPQLNISKSDHSISLLELLAPKHNNLRCKHQPPLTLAENDIDPQVPQPDPAIGGVIIYVRPAIGATSNPSQDPLS